MTTMMGIISEFKKIFKIVNPKVIVKIVKEGLDLIFIKIGYRQKEIEHYLQHKQLNNQ